MKEENRCAEDKVEELPRYKIRIICNNCDYKGYWEFPKGVRVSALKEEDCPKCGCDTLRKSEWGV